MKRPKSLTVRGLFRRRFRSNPLSSILVSVLVLLAAGVAASAPRLVARQDTAELTYQLQQVGPVGRALNGDTRFQQEWYPGSSPSAHEIYGPLDDAFTRAFQAFGSPLSTAVSKATWIAQTPTLETSAPKPAAHKIGVRLTADENYLSRIRIVSGTRPAVWGGDDELPPSAASATPIEILISRTAAHSLGVGVGDLLGSSATSDQPSYRVSGLFVPIDSSAQYWAENPSLVPAFLEKPPKGASYLAASAFIDPVSVGGLGEAFSVAQISLYYPLDAHAVDGADAEQFRQQIAAVITDGIRMPGDGTPVMSVSSGAPDAIEGALQRDAVLGAFLALIASAPLGVTLAVLGLAVQAVVRARRRDIALAIARGASGVSVRWTMAIEGLILSVPATLVATALAATLILARPQPSDYVLPALVAITPGVLFALLPVTGFGVTERSRLLRQLRGVAEAAVVALAILALFLLSRRGLAQSSTAVGIDPLMVATPLLLAVAVGIVVLRGYPILLRALRRRATRSRGLPGFVGSIRATRSPTVGLVGVLALVVGMSIAMFSTIMLSTFDGATERAAAASVGADVRVDSPGLSERARDAVGSLPGVSAVAGVAHLDTRTLRGMGIIDTVNVLLAQTGPLRSVRPHLAAGLDKEVDGKIPVVVSSDLSSEVRGHADLKLDEVPITVVGSLPADSQLGPTRSWILVDSAFAGRFTASFTPDLLLVRAAPSSLGGIRALVVRAVGSKASVATVSSVVTQRRSEPAVQGVRSALLVGAVISALLSAIALVLSTVVAARARARTAGILRTLGLPARSLRVLVAWELVPVVLVAVIAGTLLGVALPYLLIAAVDLRTFAGGTARPVPIFDPGLLGLVNAAFCLVVVIVGIVAVAAGERRNPSNALRMGAE